MGSFRGGEQWGLGVLRPMLPRGEVASCQKVAVAALDLRGCSPLGLGGLVLSHEGTLGAGLAPGKLAAWVAQSLISLAPPNPLGVC